MNNHFLSNINHVCFLTALFCFVLLMLTAVMLKTKVAVYVLIDKTDDSKRSTLLVVDGQSLLSILPAQANQISVITSVITDVSFNKQSFLSFQTEATSGLNNPLIAAEKKGFINELDTAFASIAALKSNHSGSQIYFSICKQLHELSKNTANHKILIIESNLLENSHFASFIGKSKAIKANPEPFLLKLSEQCELPDLTGIDIYLLWQPQSKKEDRDYLAASVFQFLLENKAVTVSVGVNLSDKI